MDPNVVITRCSFLKYDGFWPIPFCFVNIQERIFVAYSKVSGRSVTPIDMAIIAVKLKSVGDSEGNRLNMSD